MTKEEKKLIQEYIDLVNQITGWWVKPESKQDLMYQPTGDNCIELYNATLKLQQLVLND